MSRRGKRARRGGMSLRTRLTISYSVALALLVLSVGVSYSLVATRGLTGYALDASQDVAASVALSLENSLLLESEVALQVRAETAMLFIEDLVAEADELGVSEDRLQEQAIRILNAQQVGPAGYFFVLGRDGRLVAHPEAELVGQDLSDAGVVSQVLEQGSGFIQYEWQNPSDAQARAKTGYIVPFPQWGWFVTASDYTHGLADRISSERLHAILGSIQLSSVLGVALVNDDDQFVAASSTWPRVWAQSGFRPALLSSATSIAENRRTVLATVPFDPFGGRVAIIYSLDPLRRVIDRFLLVAGISIIPALLVIFVMSNISAKMITAPMRNLTERMLRRLDVSGEQGVTANGDLRALMLSQLRTVVRLQYSLRREKKAETSLVVANQVFLNTAEGICVTDADGTIRQVNPAFVEATGYAEEELLGQPIRLIRSNIHGEDFFAELWQSLQSSGSWSGEIWNKKRNGDEFPQLCSIGAVRDSRSGRVESYVAVYHDISEIKNTEQHLQHLASHDTLTGLPNRSFLTDMLQFAVPQAARESRQIAVLFLDLDDFKDVNDSFGHDAGDQLLQWVARKFRDELRGQDVIARFGGDEFVVVLRDVEDADGVALVARRLLAAAREPYTVGNQLIRPSVSIGVAIYPDGDRDPSTLLRDADAAMYAAKRAGRNDYRFHDPHMNATAHRRLAMQGAIAQAIDQEELVAVFQPIHSLTADGVTAAEALVRWRSEGRMVPPGDFLPYLENSSMITRLDLWVLQQACRILLQYGDRLPRAFHISVNVGAWDLVSEDFAARATETVHSFGVPPSRICLEVTESAAIKSFDRARETLRALRLEGFGLYLDDFGAGHSSIRYLREFGVDAVKLDRQFLSGVENSESVQSLVSGFISLARGMHLATIIEGIESAAQLDFVKEAGADYVQGYYTGKPMAFAELLENTKIVSPT
ncbi:MAG: EAL domain-containing protein [Spirochaetota bacterium]